MPGFDAKSIQMQVQNNILLIFAMRPAGIKGKGKGTELYAHTERSRDVPTKTIIPLPSEVDQDKIKAEFKDGVLRLCCPIQHASEKKKILFSNEEYPFAK